MIGVRFRTGYHTQVPEINSTQENLLSLYLPIICTKILYILVF
jgi:hypothetical protein